MESGRIIFGVGVGLASLFLRWRFPSVPKPFATFGIVFGLGVAVWSLSAIPVTLAFSLIFNIAFVALIVELLIARRSSIVPRSEVELRANATEKERREQQISIDILATARSLDHVLGEGNEGGMRNAIPGLRATLLTLQKYYGLTIPSLPDRARPRRVMQVGGRYLGEIDPLLRQNHIEEARQRADILVPMLNAFVNEQTNDLPDAGV